MASVMSEMMSLGMHQAFEITTANVRSYNYKDETQQPTYQCHDQIIIIQSHTGESQIKAHSHAIIEQVDETRRNRNSPKLKEERGNSCDELTVIASNKGRISRIREPAKLTTAK
jgi:hypothetical protein